MFFNAGYAHYDRCLAGELRFVSDYDSMRATGLLYRSTPDFATLMANIRDAERRVNASF